MQGGQLGIYLTATAEMQQSLVSDTASRGPILNLPYSTATCSASAASLGHALSCSRHCLLLANADQPTLLHPSATPTGHITHPQQHICCWHADQPMTLLACRLTIRRGFTPQLHHQLQLHPLLHPLATAATVCCLPVRWQTEESACLQADQPTWLHPSATPLSRSRYSLLLTCTLTNQ